MSKTISFRMYGVLIAACGSLLLAMGDAQAQTASPSPTGRVVGIAFVGRMVSNLDKSVAFYKAIGFTQDPGTDSSWRKDAALDALFAVKGAQYRTAKMTINSNISGQPFAVYLRELKDIKRKNMAGYTTWEPGATHFGLTVPDIDELWSQLTAGGMLKSRTWEGKLVRPPGQTKGGSAYITDPDGLDVEVANQRPPAPADNGRPANPGNPPGFSHIGVVVLDADKARSFYTGALGGQTLTIPTQWMDGDFVDSLVGGHGNIVRIGSDVFPEAAAPDVRMKMEMVEYQNRKKPVEDYTISDIGVAYVGLQVEDLDAVLARVNASGAKLVSRGGVVKMPDGTRAVLVRDPDVGAFVELFEPRK